MVDDGRRRSWRHSATWLDDIPVLGPEDVAIDHAAGLAYVSSQDRLGWRWLLPGVLRERDVDWTARGRLYGIDLRKKSSLSELDVPLPPGSGFHPAGIDLHVDPAGRRRLFVVNWRTATEFSIEVFDIVGGRLCHAATATTSALTLPNDVVALNERQFYVSNSLSLPRPTQAMEKIFCLPSGSVLFHDLGTGTWRHVAFGIRFPNGLALDRKRRRLFVASTLSRKILAYPWNPEKPSEPVFNPAMLRLDFLPDNLAWEDENRDVLWAAGSEYWASIPYTLMLSQAAPSHVARIRLAGKAATDPFRDVRPEPVYSDDGREIAQCSIGSPFHHGGERRFMVGSCFDDHLSVFREAA